MFKIEMAGITVEIDNEYSFIEELAADYLSDGRADISVRAEAEEIENTAKRLSVSRGYAESVAVYSRIADELYRFDALLVHGVALEYRGEVYLICADSGVGKSTHAALWKRAFGDEVKILNGDKPIIRKIGAEFYAAGTPWRGKEREGGRGMTRVKAICYLSRADENRARGLDKSMAAASLIKHIYMPRTASAIVKTLSLADELSAYTAPVELFVNMEISAATVARDFLLKNTKKG